MQIIDILLGDVDFIPDGSRSTGEPVVGCRRRRLRQVRNHAGSGARTLWTQLGSFLKMSRSRSVIASSKRSWIGSLNPEVVSRMASVENSGSSASAACSQ